MSIEAARLAVGVDTSDIDQADRKLRELSDHTGRAGSFMQGAGATAAGFLGAQLVTSIGGAGAAMFTLGQQTQDMLNNFQAVSGLDDAGMKKVQQLARDLGNDMTLPATSAKDATEAMLELNKAGLSVADSMAAAKGALQLSAAAGTDAGTAATITANALNMFGLKGDEAGRVADLLAAAANTSSGSIDDMAYALRMSGTVAAQANIPIETLTAMIGEMANKGLTGSDAGTSLKQMILSLEAPSNKAAAWMKAWGVEVFDAEGKMRSVTDIIGDFAKAKAGAFTGEVITDDVWASGLTDIFGSDAVRAANVVIGEGVDGLNQMTAAVTKEGAAQEVAAAKMRGVGGAIAGLQSQLETLAIDGFNAIAPAAEKVVRWVADELPHGIEMAKTAITGFIDVARPVVTWAVDFVEANPVPVLAGIGAVVATVIVPAFIAWAAATIAATLPLTALIVGIGLLVGGLVYAYTHFETFRTVVDTVAGAVQDTVSALVDWWKAHWDQIAEAVTHVWTVITDAVTVGVGMVMTLWHAFGDDIVNAAKLAWGFLSGIVQSAMEVVRGIIQTVLALINGDWGQAWDGIKQILSGVWDGIQTLVATAIGAVRSTIELALSALGFVWAGFWGGLGKVVDDVRDGIKTGVDKIVDFLLSIPKRIAGLGADILKEITGGAAGLVGKAISLIPGFADGGAVTAGRSIVVGERGPELFTPGASGMITPNAYLSGAAAGVGGGNTYITVQVDAANSYIDQRFADVLERHLLDLSRRASLTSRGVNV